MAEPLVSLYVAGAALDTNVSLGGDVVNLKSFVLASTISDSATTIPAVATISGINAPCYILLDSELVWAEGISGANFTSCVRGAGGTVAASHTSGINIDAVYAANSFNQLKRAIIAIETELGLAPSGASSDLVTRLALFATLASPTFTGTVILPKTLEIQDTSADHQYVLGVSELAADRTITFPLLTGNDVFVFAAHAQTTTNKRNQPRFITTTQSATPTINTDNGDIFNITGLAQAITSFTTNLSGTPVAGERMTIEITDDGTARTLTFGASFASTTVTLPTTTVISTRLRIQFEWSTVTSKWECIGKA